MSDNITAEPHAPPLAAGEREFFNVKDFMRCYGVGRSYTYNLLGAGKIRSITLRERGKIRGKRLIDAKSAREFFSQQPDDVTPELRASMQRAQAKSAERKREKKQASSNE